MGVERDLTSGCVRMVRYTDDVLLSCTIDTYVVLLTNVPPIHSIKTKEKKKKEERLGLQQPSISLSPNPCWFSQPEVMGDFSSWRWTPGLGSLGWGLDPLLLRGVPL